MEQVLQPDGQEVCLAPLSWYLAIPVISYREHVRRKLAEVLKAATGFDYDLEESMECGEHVWMLQCGLNNLMGVTLAMAEQIR